MSVWQRSLPRDSGEFVFVRGTYGEGVDVRVEKHVSAARERGLYVGLYAFGVHYYGHNVSPGPVQADVLLRLADKLKIERVALDWERDGVRPQMTAANARAFISRVKAVHGECGLYASAWQFKDLGQTWDWVAQWGTRPPTWNWDFWQYQGTPIDRNLFNGSSMELSDFFSRRDDRLDPKPVPRPIPDAPEGDDPMFNVGPITTHRDAVLKAGTVLFEDSGLKRRHSRVEEATPLGFAGSKGTTAHVVINAGYTNYVRRSDVSEIVANEREFE